MEKKTCFTCLPFWKYMLLLFVVQLPSHAQLLVTPWTAACQASMSYTVFQSLLKLKCIESMMPSNHLTRCCPLLLMPSIFPSIRVFSNESVLCIRWPKYWSFSFSIHPSNGCSEVIFFRIGWFDLLAVQGTLKSFLQHHNLKASILWCSAFFMVQLSHLYMTTRKIIALTTQTFISKIMSLLFFFDIWYEIYSHFNINYLIWGSDIIFHFNRTFTWLQSQNWHY